MTASAGSRSEYGVTAQPLAIELRAVTKRYGPAVVLDDISLKVEPGEFMTLLGPSGSGKTTLLNIIAGFAEPDSGRLIIGNEDVTAVPPHLRGIGMVFQSYALFPHMSVGDNVAFPLKARRVASSAIGERVQAALSMVKLQGFEGRRIDQLSGGQKQRVALARAIVFQPKLILMDEPLSALDKQLREHMQIEIRALHERLGATTIYVTHDQREALTMSSRVAVLEQGRIAQLGTPTEIYNRPADAFVADFVGEAVLASVTKIDSMSVSLNGQRIVSAHPLPDAQELALVIRSEKLRLEPDAALNAIQAVVREVIFQGESFLLVAEAGGGLLLTIRQPSHTETDSTLPRPGETATFALHPEHAVVVARRAADKTAH